VRRYGEFRYAARSWQVERRVIGRVEASPRAATVASSSPTSKARRAGSTRASIAPAAKPRI
jgi:hypothetical protein